MKPNLTPEQEKMVTEQKIKGLQRTIKQQARKLEEIEKLIDKLSGADGWDYMQLIYELKEVIHNTSFSGE